MPTLFEVEVVPPPGYEITIEEAALGLAAIRLMIGGHLTAELLIAYYEETMAKSMRDW